MEGPIPDEYIALAGILIFVGLDAVSPGLNGHVSCQDLHTGLPFYSVICSRNMKGTACNGENVFAENAMMVVACDIQGTLSIDGESSFGVETGVGLVFPILQGIGQTVCQ